MYFEREKKESDRCFSRIFESETFLTFLLRCDRGKRADRGKFCALLSFALFGGVKAHSSSSRLLLFLLLCVCACVFCSVKLFSHRVFFSPKDKKKLARLTLIIRRRMGKELSSALKRKMEKEKEEAEKKAAAFAELEEDYCYLENAVTNGQLDELKYLVEEAKVSLHGDFIASARILAYARYYEITDCLNYLREKGCPEPTDEEYAEFVEDMRPKKAIKSVPAPPKSRAPKKVPVKKAPAKKKAVPKALAAKKAALKKYASGKLQHALQKVDLEDH